MNAFDRQFWDGLTPKQNREEAARLRALEAKLKKEQELDRIERSKNPPAEKVEEPAPMTLLTPEWRDLTYQVHNPIGGNLSDLAWSALEASDTMFEYAWHNQVLEASGVEFTPMPNPFG